jgi:hypothetical protein
MVRVYGELYDGDGVRVEEIKNRGWQCLVFGRVCEFTHESQLTSYSLKSWSCRKVTTSKYLGASARYPCRAECCRRSMCLAGGEWCLVGGVAMFGDGWGGCTHSYTEPQDSRNDYDEV